MITPKSRMPLDFDIPIRRRPLPILDCTRLGLRPLDDLDRTRHGGAIRVVAITGLAIAAIMAFVDFSPSSAETPPNPPSSAHSAKK